MGSGGRRRRVVILAGATAGAVLAAGAGLWATDSPPFRDSYCWGAWEQDSGPEFLGDDVLDGRDAERFGTQSAPPSADRSSATCTVTLNTTDTDRDSGGTIVRARRVVVDFGPVPAEAGERRAWLARNLDGSTSPLPDGLDGMAAEDRAMLVLPRACDVDGRPSAVTLRGEGSDTGFPNRNAAAFQVGSSGEVARMLVDAANTGMRKAGCAPGEPLRVTSPLDSAEPPDDAGSPLCRVPGLTYDLGSGSRFRQQVGVVGERLQTCSVVWPLRGGPDEHAAQFVMAGEPRMAALFAGLPEGSGHGLVHLMCDGRRTVFYAHLGDGLKDRGRPDDERAFKNFTTSVSERIGCDGKETA